MREKIKNSPITFSAPIATCSGLLLQDHQTLEIPSMLRPKPTTGLTRTGKLLDWWITSDLFLESGMRRTATMKWEEHRCTCFKVSFSETTYLESRLSPLSSTSSWSQDADTLETLTKSWTLELCHPAKSSRLPGTERWFSLDALLRVKLVKQTPCQSPRSLTRKLEPPFQMPETLVSSCAQPFALIWAAFQFLTWEHTRDGSASAMDQSTTNLAVFVRDQPRVTFHPSTIRCTENSFVLKRWSSPTSHLSICTFEMPVLVLDTIWCKC